ncbi:hypothetical protein [Spiroplasma endosymbiont of Stenodema calcarata]|uniref:hypothetical protein n=1 Tax=Spiroplasma endosymbiont of Stenodema calcarata TaxID=3139328 RepID=UPI003CCB3F40
MIKTTSDVTEKEKLQEFKMLLITLEEHLALVTDKDIKEATKMEMEQLEKSISILEEKFNEYFNT